MKLLNSNEIILKKSKFIAYFYKIDNLNEIDSILNEIKREHKKANHFPYAYILNQNYKKNDDGEPNGTAGTPIFNILDKNNFTNHLIIVVRYFGGIKLGTGGLLRAFNKSASEVIKF